MLSDAGAVLVGIMAGKQPDELSALLVDVLNELPTPQVEAVLDAVLVTVRRRAENNPKASRMSPDLVSMPSWVEQDTPEAQGHGGLEWLGDGSFKRGK